MHRYASILFLNSVVLSSLFLSMFFFPAAAFAEIPAGGPETHHHQPD